MRAYVLVHSALSGIQKGIQAGHALVEMGLKGHPLYREWAEKHKTVIVLEGGFQADLEQAEAVLMNVLEGSELSAKQQLPWAAFREDQETLNGTLTAVAVILPEEIYGEISVTVGESMNFPNLSGWKQDVWRLMYGPILAR